MASFDWDDLRIFLASARAGSFGAAADRLTIDPSTVGRKLSRLETALQSTLVKRSPGGLELTAAGTRLLAIAVDAERAMNNAADIGAQHVVGGVVRLSVAEGFGTMVLAPHLSKLRSQHSQLRIELAANSGFLSTTRREVDMAVTLAPPTDPRLAAQMLTKYQLAAYAAPDYLKRRGEPVALADLARHELVGYVEDLIYAPQLRYLTELDPQLRPSLSSTSIRAQREIIASGGGIGVLPCFMGQGLRRVLDSEILLTRQFWISAHSDVADIARVRSVIAWIKALVVAERTVLTPYPNEGSATIVS